MTIDILNVVPTIVAVGTVLGAVLWRQRSAGTDLAQVEAVKNWRELAEARGEQIEERDRQIRNLTERMTHLENRFNALESENTTLRDVVNSGVRLAPELRAAMTEQSANIAASLKIATAEIAHTLSFATETQHREIMAVLAKLEQRG